MITLWEPWATAIALGYKHYETRSWPAPNILIGRFIGIHASKKQTGELRQITHNLIDMYPELAVIEYDQLHFGCIIAACRLIACYRTESIEESLPDLELSLGDYSPGRYAWELEIIKLPEKPIPAVGKQGIWDWEG